jgi:hypothetical protein
MPIYRNTSKINCKVKTTKMQNSAYILIPSVKLGEHEERKKKCLVYAHTGFFWKERSK